MRNSIKAMVFGSLLATMVVSTGAFAQAGDKDNATVVHKNTVVKGDNRTTVRHKNVVRRGDVVRTDTVVHHHHHYHYNHPVDAEWYRIHRHHHHPYYYQNGHRVFYRNHDHRDWGHTRGHNGDEHRDHDRNDRGHNNQDHGNNDHGDHNQNRDVKRQDH